MQTGRAEHNIADLKYILCLMMDTARLAQSAERKTLNLVVVGSSPTLGDLFAMLSNQLPHLSREVNFFYLDNGLHSRLLIKFFSVFNRYKRNAKKV